MDYKEVQNIARLVAAEIIAELQQYEIRYTEIAENGERIKGYYSIEGDGSSFECEMALRRIRESAWRKSKGF